jgi:pimeloyl-ACP methyl ester carboxylesterase
MTPFFREAGAGPGVVCLHANASTSGQWRGLADLLAPKFHVFAVDSYGSGKTPAWPEKRLMTLSDEAALLEPVFAGAGERFALVGHSYGGAVALVTALKNPRRWPSMSRRSSRSWTPTARRRTMPTASGTR